MTERPPNLTQRARKVLELESAAAEQFNHGFVTPVHVAVAIIREGGGVASTAMRFHGIAPRDVEPDLLRALANQPMADVVPAFLPLGDDAQQLLQAAAREAEEMEDNHLGTEHLLLALLRQEAGVPSQVFGAKGMRYSDARARIEWIMTADPQDPAPFRPPRDASPGAS